MFHQVEGLAIDKDLSMANLKWVLEEFVKAFLEVDGGVELRSAHPTSRSPNPLLRWIFAAAGKAAR